MKTIYATLRGVLLFASLLASPAGFAQIHFTVPATPAPAPVTALEYFIDTDPGMGAATPISLTSGPLASATATANIAGLAPGIHQLWLRARSGGAWGTAQKALFVVRPAAPYFPAHAAQHTIRALEYFFDADPGPRHGSIVNVTPAQLLQGYNITANISGLQNLATHRLFVRTVADGVSVAASSLFGKGIAPLPIQLRSFSASRAGNAVSLDWETVQEADNDHFEVERSSDAQAFYRIATVAAQGDGKGAMYHLSDGAPLPGRGYYRLKQVDRSGSFSYSAVAVVQAQSAAAGLSFNNPAGDMLVLRHASRGAAIALLDLQGRTVLRSECSGEDVQQVPLNALAPGMYLLRYTSEAGSTTTRLLKQ